MDRYSHAVPTLCSYNYVYLNYIVQKEVIHVGIISVVNITTSAVALYTSSSS